MMNQQAENSALIGDAQKIDLADRKKGELPRIITRYPVRLPDGQEAAFELNGLGERYVGRPACIPYNGELTEFTDFEEGKACRPVDDIEGAVVCSRLMDADAIHRAGIHKVYILAGDPALAIADGYEMLCKEPCLTLLDSPDQRVPGMMRTERQVIDRLGKAVRLRLPGREYRANRGASVMDFDDIVTAARTATVQAPTIAHSLDGYSPRRKDDTERLPLRFPRANDLLGGGLPRGEVALLTSREGTGKSTMIEQTIADAIADPNSRHRALIYSGEKRMDDIAEELTRMIAGPAHLQQYTTRAGYTGYSVPDDVWDDIKDRCIAPHCWVLSPSYDSTWERIQDGIEQMIVQQGIDIILIDNLMTICDWVPSTSVYDAQGRVARWLEGIALKYNIWVILIAHRRKTQSGQSTTDDISGAKDTANAAGTVLVYDRYEPKDGDSEDDTLRTLKVLKNRIRGRISTPETTDYLTYDPASLRTYSTGSTPDWRNRWSSQYKARAQASPRITLTYTDYDLDTCGGTVKDIQDAYGACVSSARSGRVEVYIQYTGADAGIDREPVLLTSGKEADSVKAAAYDWGIQYTATGC